jgi:hypothetical protein
MADNYEQIYYQLADMGRKAQRQPRDRNARFTMWRSPEKPPASGTEGRKLTV